MLCVRSQVHSVSACLASQGLLWLDRAVACAAQGEGGAGVEEAACKHLCLSLFESGEMPPADVVTRLAVLGFVRTTCARSGSFAKDWWDRSGVMLDWMEKNVMSLEDLTWAREGMTIVTGEGESGEAQTEEGALRAEGHNGKNGGFEEKSAHSAL